MAGKKKITVVLSQAPTKAQRDFEESVAAALIMDSQVDFGIVPHLYDLPASHTGTLFLRSIPGDMVVLAWLYPRAARWVLDRQGIHGQAGQSRLHAEDDGDEEDEVEGDSSAPPAPRNGAQPVPDRKIYCLDLREAADPQVYIDEVGRIAAESRIQTVDLMGWIQGQPKAEQLARYLQPHNGHAHAAIESAQSVESVGRRWYPVIDYERCTNCLECIDFCLFGVYGIDAQERILVEQQDNCKQGCPACSRVCPENAIIFPQYKTAAIAGADTGEAGGFKIDLSKLFGAPSAIEMAARERDHELVMDGRQAVGLAVGIPKRQQDRRDRPKDDLDQLVDGLDALDL